MFDQTCWTLQFQGAESKIKSGKYQGKDAIWKERFAKGYRHPQLDSRLSKERTRAEVRNILKIREKCPELGKVLPEILFVDERNIIMSEIKDSKTSSKYIFEETNAGTEVDWVFEAIGKIVGQIHKVGVIHGDLTTCNFLIDTKKQVIPIDFGLSSHSTSSEDRAVDLYVLERALQTTHVSDEKLKIIIDSYSKTLGSPDNEKVLKKLDEVRSRGRKRLIIG